jgi:hypothetical protein
VLGKLKEIAMALAKKPWQNTQKKAEFSLSDLDHWCKGKY